MSLLILVSNEDHVFFVCLLCLSVVYTGVEPKLFFLFNDNYLLTDITGTFSRSVSGNVIFITKQFSNGIETNLEI
jgi:hypothetical protein